MTTSTPHVAEDRPLRIALLTYRGHPEVGGQGVYVGALSRGLAALGHDVTVISGPPYPRVDRGVRLETLPSLDLYRPEDPFRRPAKSEFKDAIDLLEYASMCTGSFPEPLTFSLRAARYLRERAGRFDVVHDNQGLGYGMLSIAKNLPVVTTVHHPISIDRRMALAHAPSRAKRLGQRRWYGFVRMQARVARRLPRILAVSESAAADTVRDFGVARDRIDVVHNGVDPELFRPLPHIGRVPGRIVTVASSDLPSKGLSYLIEALAKLRTEREVHLTIIGKGGRSNSVTAIIDRFGMAEHVSITGRVDALHMVEGYARAQVAVVPSLYEGFSLPAIEALSSGVATVTTTGGALKEVVGADGDAGLLVPPGDAGALAAAVARILDSPELRASLEKNGRRRALERFTWRATAEATVESYRTSMPAC